MRRPVQGRMPTELQQPAWRRRRVGARSAAAAAGAADTEAGPDVAVANKANNDRASPKAGVQGTPQTTHQRTLAQSTGAGASQLSGALTGKTAHGRTSLHQDLPNENQPRSIK